MSTFINGNSRSQIDYILTWRFQADSLARMAKPLPGLDFSPCRLGAKHRPVEASIPLKPGWVAARRRPQRDQLYDKAGLEDSLHRSDPQAEQLRAKVEASLLEQTAPHSADSINSLLLRCCSEVYPPKRKPAALRPWQQPEVQFSLEEMWRRRRALQRIGHNVRLGLFSRRQVFEAFRAYAAFQRSYREVRSRGLWRRKQMLREKLEVARQAEQARTVGCSIRLFVPSPPKCMEDGFVYGPAQVTFLPRRKSTRKSRTILLHSSVCILMRSSRSPGWNL